VRGTNGASRHRHLPRLDLPESFPRACRSIVILLMLVLVISHFRSAGRDLLPHARASNSESLNGTKPLARGQAGRRRPGPRASQAPFHDGTKILRPRGLCRRDHLPGGYMQIRRSRRLICSRLDSRCGGEEQRDRQSEGEITDEFVHEWGCRPGFYPTSLDYHKPLCSKETSFDGPRAVPFLLCSQSHRAAAKAAGRISKNAWYG
jgi:hypothetical protein